MKPLLWSVALMMALAACAPEAAPIATTTTRVIPTTLAPSTTSTTSVMADPADVAVETTTTTAEPLAPLRGLAVEIVAEVKRPLLVLSPENDERRFLVLQAGQILILESDGSILDEPFLDIRDLVFDNSIEQGLLGVAFHPDYATNGRLFVYYTEPSNDSTLVEYAVSDDPDVVDTSTAAVMMNIGQPTERHNAGMLVFGPEGKLWMSLGEGGAAAANSQNPDTLLGSMVRIDVDAGSPYAIPVDNPYVAGEAPEVWATGLRNPWRFWIDHPSATLYIGDVGQGDWEEINVVGLDAAGSNFGWLPMEGSTCFRAGCDPSLYDLPVVEYSHAEGCSITGGVVYRGSAIPELDGHYFYSDYCQGWLKSFTLDGADLDITEWDVGELGQVTSFGTDAQGEMYITTWGGLVYKVVPIR